MTRLALMIFWMKVLHLSVVPETTVFAQKGTPTLTTNPVPFPPIYVDPIFTFKAKLDAVDFFKNTKKLSSPVRVLVGPRHKRKKIKSSREDLLKSSDYPHSDSHMDLNHLQSKSNVSYAVPSLIERLPLDGTDADYDIDRARDLDWPSFSKHRKWTVSSLLDYNRYEHRVHEVTTEDGYILTIFQLLPCNSGSQNQPNLERDPRFFQSSKIVIYIHGFMFSAIEWLIGDPENIIPYDVVNGGREAWLINLRGNEYGMRHKTLSSKSPAFWKFSFHEQAKYDMPAIVDYIIAHTTQTLSNTGREISFVCNALGTTVFYIFMDFHGTRFKQYVNFMAALSPLAYASRTSGPVTNLIPFADHFRRFPVDGPVLKSTIVDFLHFTVPEICVLKFRDHSLCEPVLLFFYGKGASNTSPSVIRRLFEHFPSTTSKRNVVHYLQLLQTDAFRQFDHGPKLNLLYYNQSVPPPYSLYNVQVPTISFYGQTDLLIDPLDVEQTLSRFGPSKVDRASYQIADYTNVEFIYSDVLLSAIEGMIYNFISCNSNESNMKNCLTGTIAMENI